MCFQFHFSGIAIMSRVLPTPPPPAPSCLPDISFVPQRHNVHHLCAALTWQSTVGMQNIHINPNWEMLFVVACYQMAVSCVCRKVFACLGLMDWQRMLRVIEYTRSLKNLLYLQNMCVCACACLEQCYGLLAFQLLTISTTCKSQLWPLHPPLWVSTEFSSSILNKTQKHMAMFTVSAQATAESRPGLGNTPPLLFPSFLSLFCLSSSPFVLGFSREENID